ncbi:MAG: Uma2 family endonuclease [Kofleriaceae bacterium]
MRVAERSRLTVAEYLAWERLQTCKHEYFEGEVYAMAGGSPRHNRLCVRVSAALDGAVGATCAVLSSDQRVRTSERRYEYPDVTVVCGSLTIEHDDVLANPTMIVEVLSASTEQYDRGLKWAGYQSLPSLTDYLLIAQDRAHVEHFARTPASRWLYSSLGTGQTIVLTTGATLEIDALFAGVLELPGDDQQSSPSS